MRLPNVHAGWDGRFDSDGETHIPLDHAMNRIVSREEARREIERHGCDWGEFVAEVIDREEYMGREVLEWLGY